MCFLNIKNCYQSFLHDLLRHCNLLYTIVKLVHMYNCFFNELLIIFITIDLLLFCNNCVSLPFSCVSFFVFDFCLHSLFVILAAND